MQQIQCGFATEPSAKDVYTTYKNYIDTFEHKINRALDGQGRAITNRKVQLQTELAKLHFEKKNIIEEMKRKQQANEQYFKEFFLKDINKYSQYKGFFSRMFEGYEKEINYYTNKNTKMKIVVESMQKQLKGLMKQNRDLQRKTLQNQQMIKYKTAVKNGSIDSTEASILLTQRPTLLQKGKQRSLSVQSLPSLVPLVKISSRYKQKPKPQTVNQVQALKMLKSILNFRFSDRHKKQWSWSQQLIYNEKLYPRLTEYLNIKLSKLQPQ